ncbi:MAG: GGDEF domain-containing phosphodiesterase [Thermaerobacter sp.]|nr:GGDEF domain-containing phosphodiesterase [Thermaerobacter sp.]
MPPTVLGWLFCPNDGTSADELLRHADLALYRAQDEGRNRVSLFNSDLEREASTAFYLDAGLRRALAANQFYLEYQPQVDILTGRTTGFEALLRWRAADGRKLSPDAFLPEAQKLGLMEEIDAWVLEQAVQEIGGLTWWHQYPMTLAVNISATSLESAEFISRLLQLLRRHGISQRCAGDVFPQGGRGRALCLQLGLGPVAAAI